MTPTSRWTPPLQPGAPIIISPRQADVLIHRGYTNEQIGRYLHITLDTAKTHVKGLFRASGAADRAHLVAITCARTVVVRGDRTWGAA